jgi:tetratricopeptide (TPR) repeat protein
MRLLLLTLVVAGLPMRAASAQVDSPPSVSDRARQLCDEALAAFAEGHYEQAIATFKASYELVPKAALLFDIALAFRRLGDCDQSLTFYRRYLGELPDAQNRATVQMRIAEMERCAKLPPAPAAESPAVAVAPPPAVPAVPAMISPPPRLPPLLALDDPPPPRRAWGRARRAPLVGSALGAAVGLVSLSLAVHFSVDAARASAEISRLFRRGGQWSSSPTEIDARGRQDNLAAPVLFALGGASLAGSAALLGWTWRERRAPRFSLGPAPGGAMAWYAARF